MVNDEGTGDAEPSLICIVSLTAGSGEPKGSAELGGCSVDRSVAVSEAQSDDRNGTKVHLI